MCPPPPQQLSASLFLFHGLDSIIEHLALAVPKIDNLYQDMVQYEGAVTRCATGGPPGVIGTGVVVAPDDSPDRSRQRTGDDEKESWAADEDVRGTGAVGRQRRLAAARAGGGRHDERIERARGEEEDAVTMSAAMLLRGRVRRPTTRWTML